MMRHGDSRSCPLPLPGQAQGGDFTEKLLYPLAVWLQERGTTSLCLGSVIWRGCHNSTYLCLLHGVARTKRAVRALHAPGQVLEMDIAPIVILGWGY